METFPYFLKDLLRKIIFSVSHYLCVLVLWINSAVQQEPKISFSARLAFVLTKNVTPE